MNAEEAKKLAIRSNTFLSITITFIEAYLKSLASNGKFSLKVKNLIFAPKESSNSCCISMSPSSNEPKYEGIISKILPGLTEDILSNFSDETLAEHHLYGESCLNWVKILEPIITSYFLEKGFRVEGSGINMVISWY